MQALLADLAVQLRASLTPGDDTPERIRREAMNSAAPGGALSLTLRRRAADDRTPFVLPWRVLKSCSSLCSRGMFLRSEVAG